MGKEQELLDAARNGNYSMVEKILNYRSKKSGPLASLRRCPGPNTTDSCGYTCLHHAALNGHKSIVELLLSHDANPNIVDNKGSTALHLAAWTGDYEIVNMLLTQSSHVPNVNLKNNDMETALHCAAQYGHTSVVSLLLQKGSDPMCRNVKDESALDLAAQYGRTDTVELFLRTRPGLVRHLTAKHSPLHLSARNGHKNVVKLLIDAKFDTETGSALHEASLYGKIEVVKLLLKSGIDIDLEDCQKRTVLDLLNDLNNSIAKQTKKLIKEHNSLLTADLEDSSTLMSDCSSHCISPPPGYTDNTPEHHYNDQTLTDGIASPAMTSASEFSFYEALPNNNRNSINRSSTGSDDYKSLKPRLSRSRDSVLDGHSTSSSRSPSYLDYDIPPPLPPRHFTNTQSLEVNTNNFYETPPLPIAISCSPEDYSLLRRHNQLNNYELEMRPESQSSIASSQSGYGRTGEKPVPPAKPPRKSISPVNRSQTINSYDYNHTIERQPINNRNGMKNSGNSDRNCDNYNTDRQFSTLKDTRRRLIEESDFSLLYDQIANGTAIGLTTSSLNRPSAQLVVSRGQPLNSHNRSRSEHQTKYYSESFSDTYNENTLKSNNYKTNNKTKRATVQIPIQSCDNIVQHCNGQTTPDYEPPSPTTAINGIQAVIQPLSQNGFNDTIDYPQQCPYYALQTECPFLNRTSINQKSFNYFNFCTDFADEKMIPAIYPNQNGATEYKKLQNGRRRSHRDIETLTEEELFARLDSSGYVRLSFRNKPLNSDNNNVIKKSVAVSTDNEIPIHLNNNFNNKYNNKKNIYNNYCETLKLDRSGEKENPFAGLCRGSIGGSSSVKRRDITDGRKSLRRQRNFNCDINIYSTLKRNKNKKSKSMENNDKKGLKVMKGNNSFDDCLQTGAKSGAESDQRSDSRISRLSVSPFDETAEWAEIANIMASFGSGIGRDSSLLNSELDNSYTSYLSKDSSSTEFEEQSVEEWLTRIGLSEYANLLINNGFDNVLFMGSNVMDDSDLLEIGVTNASHRDRILSEAKHLPKVRLLTKSDEQMSVDQWLESLKLTQYRQSFQSNGYSEMSRVRNLWEVELNTVLEINKLGHRKRILASLGERLRLIEDLGLDDLDFDKLNLNISQLSVDEGFDTCSTTTTTNTNNNTDTNKPIDKNVENRDKNTTKLTKTSIEVKNDKCLNSSQSKHQWKHTNKELTDSSCRYRANYLGSTLVRELRGIDSTRASIQKLKMSTKGIAKIPQIILSISYSGVKFIDAETETSVCEHEIRNIHCICQDSEDLNHFAYITKESETNNNYCHVFSAPNTELVTEIILTLGQAFEIAYQMVLENSDKYEKHLTNNSANICINTYETNNNNKNNNKINASININNPQNDIKPNNEKESHKKEDINKILDNIQKKSETNVKPMNNTFITTISITSSSDQKTNPKSKTAEQKPINQIYQANNNNNNKLAKNGQGSINSRRSDEPISSIPLPTVIPSKTVSNTSSTTAAAIPVPIQQTTKVRPLPATGKPSPPTITKSGFRPIPSPKPSTIPKPVARAKPVPPFKPLILAKPTNK